MNWVGLGRPSRVKFPGALGLVLLLGFAVISPARSALSISPNGCYSESGTDGVCQDGLGLNSPYRVVLSPDERNVYVASGASDAIAVFSRDVVTGALTQLPATAGCVSEDGTGGLCGVSRGLDLPYDLAVSPDGKFLYAASLGSSAVAVFARDASTGGLTQLAGADGCVSAVATDGCMVGRGLGGAGGVALSPDGLNLYVAADGGTPDVDGGVAVFSRDKDSGALTQLPGSAGCVSETGYDGACADDHALDGATRAVVSHDGRHVYVASLFSDAISVFARDASTGALTQVPGADGCVSETGSGGTCADGRGLDYLHDVAVSPDDHFVYGAAVGSNAISAFSRDAESGVLTQLDGAAGCVAATTDGGCAGGHDLDGPINLAISPDGRRLYVAAYYASAVNVFSRGLGSGALSQAACVSIAGGACATAGQLHNVSSLAISPDGLWLYAVAPTDDALTWFGVTPPAGSPPQCADTAVSVVQDTAQVVSLVCTEPDGDVVTRSIVAGPAHGTLGAIDQDAGTVTYTPAAGYAGADAFQFTASDVDGASAAATATLQIEPAPVDPGPESGTPGAPGTGPVPIEDPSAADDPGPLATGNEPPVIQAPVIAVSQPDHPVLPTPTSDPPTRSRPPAAVLKAVTKNFPSPSRCISRKRFSLHLNEPRNSRISTADISLAGRHRHARGGHIARTYTWRNLPRGRLTLAVKLVFNSGKILKKGRTYTACPRG